MLMPALELGLTSPRLREKRFCVQCSSFGAFAGSSCTAHLRAVSLPGASLPNGDFLFFFFIIWTFFNILQRQICICCSWFYGLGRSDGGSAKGNA